MISIEEMEELLDEIATELPKELFTDLNGGIMLLPEAKPHPEGTGNDLFILGEYHRGGNLGRFINIYYGSFERVYGYLSRAQMKEQLEKTLKHEFVHHLESMAGEKDLEKKDVSDLMKYFERKK